MRPAHQGLASLLLILALVSMSEGQSTVTSTGGGGGAVSSVTGTANQVTASPTTGAVVLTTPQNIHTGASPTFAGMTLTGPVAGADGTAVVPTYRFTSSTAGSGLFMSASPVGPAISDGGATVFNFSANGMTAFTSLSGSPDNGIDIGPVGGTFRQINAGTSMNIGATLLTRDAGEIGLNRRTAAASAPGAAGAKLAIVCGTAAGSLRIQILGGTSTTPVTIVDNIGTGATGC